MKVNKVCCIGAGYVGGPTMAVIALKCPDIEVTVVDVSKERIDAWNGPFDQLPVYEPGLKEVVEESRGRNLFFSTDIDLAIDRSQMVFMAVNTPTKKDGEGAGMAADLKYVEACAKNIARVSKTNKIVIEKSTLPVRTAEKIKEILLKYGRKDVNFEILSNPEFLAEGTAINDLQNPERVLIGGDDEIAIESLSFIYSKWIDKNKILKTNLWSSELSKLTANAFLAQRISSINAISGICEVTGANIHEVANAIGSDSRIGSKFLKPGPGFGGSCFKKDILNLVYLCRFYGLNEVASYWENIVNINSWQQKRISKIVIDNLFGTISEKKIAILGFSFKANTNDTRESPSINISKDLLQEDAKLAFYDPRVNKKQIISEFQTNSNTFSFEVCESALEACINSDAVIVLTEWEEFKFLDWEKIFKGMRKPAWVFDTRICLDKDALKEIGFKVWTLGS